MIRMEPEVWHLGQEHAILTGLLYGTADSREVKLALASPSPNVCGASIAVNYLNSTPLPSSK